MQVITIIYSLAFLLLFSAAELLYHKANWKAENTRKLVHFTGGLFCLGFPLLIGTVWEVLLLCGSFLSILLISQRTGHLPSINNVPRTTAGSILFPIIIAICYAVFHYANELLIFYLPVLILAISDPIAALIGQRFPIIKIQIRHGSKSLGGSLAFFISALAISNLSLIFYQNMGTYSALNLSLIIAFTGTIAELLVIKGFDNITIPVSTLGCLFLYQQFYAL